MRWRDKAIAFSACVCGQGRGRERTADSLFRDGDARRDARNCIKTGDINVFQELPPCECILPEIADRAFFFPLFFFFLSSNHKPVTRPVALARARAITQYHRTRHLRARRTPTLISLF